MQQFTIEKGFLVSKLYIPNKNSNKYEPLKVIVDTGAFVTVIDPEFTDYLGYCAIDAFALSTLDGAAGKSEGYSICIPKLKCLGFEINNIIIACHDIDSKLGIKGLLGMNILRNFRIDLNYQTGKLYKIKNLNV
jgi:predicted aspartyl protease